MKTARTGWRPGACALAFAALAPAAHAGVADVRFVEPAKFSDAGRSEAAIARTTQALARHIGSLAARLPASQVLRVEVLEVDLAGRIEWYEGRQVRVLTGGADWPQITLRWQLEDAGRQIASGEDRLVDMAYLKATSDRGSEALTHEKRLLERWFAERIATTAR